MPHAPTRDGARIRYDELGHGEPLLLLSGQATDAHGWDGIAESLARHHRVLTYDQRGTGGTEAPEPTAEQPWTTRLFAADAAAVLTAARIPRAHLYGVSMGGRVAQWLAVDHARRVGALVLASTTPGDAHGVARDPEVDRLMATAGDLGSAVRLLELMASRRFLAAGTWTAWAPQPMTAAARAGHFAASQGHDAWDVLPLVTAPTLVLHGDDDRVNVVANAHLLAERVPGAETAIIPGGRHAAIFEMQAQCDALVLGFLARHPL
ncbi:alpha/beta hydrolase [Rhodococcus aerolatus]